MCEAIFTDVTHISGCNRKRSKIANQIGPNNTSHNPTLIGFVIFINSILFLSVSRHLRLHSMNCTTRDDFVKEYAPWHDWNSWFSGELEQGRFLADVFPTFE